MEIVAHALWATAAAKGANRFAAARVRVLWFALWAGFPDLLAFVPETAVALWFGGFKTVLAHGHAHDVLNIDLYPPGHSLVVFAPVLALVCLAFRRPVWSMAGWALHILMDIPTHSAHYPTPFLWPVSPYRIAGISWRSWWFMGLSYAALALVFLLLWRTSRPAGERGR